MTYKHVVVPLEDFGGSVDILPQLEHLLDAGACHLILLHVASLPAARVGRGPQKARVPLQAYTVQESREEVVRAKHPIYAEQEQASLEAHLQVQLEGYARPLREQGFTVSTVIRYGRPADEIVRYAEEEKVDLVAMLARRRRGLSRLAPGSVSEAVFERSSVPVLLMHGVNKT
jgi:nucleotide-binding universal stress UspA family protein